MAGPGFIWACLRGLIKHRTRAASDLPFLLVPVGLLPGLVCVSTPHEAEGRTITLLLMPPTAPCHPFAEEKSALWILRCSSVIANDFVHPPVYPSIHTGQNTHSYKLFPAVIFLFFKFSRLCCFCSEFHVPLISFDFSPYPLPKAIVLWSCFSHLGQGTMKAHQGKPLLLS